MQHPNASPRSSPRDDDVNGGIETILRMQTQHIQNAVQHLEEMYKDDHENMQTIRNEVVKLSFTAQHTYDMIHQNIDQFRESIQQQLESLKREYTQDINTIKTDLAIRKEKETTTSEQIVQLREFRSTIKGILIVTNIAIAGGFVLLGALLK